MKWSICATAASSTTCCGEWHLAEQPGPLTGRHLRLTGIFLAVVLAGLGVGAVLRSPEVAVAEVGRPAPDFTLPLIGGGEFSLSEQLAAEDKMIVLNLWASWCVPCRTETPEISAFATAHPDVKVIGVAVEDTETDARSFADELMPDYDLALGDDEFEEAYPRIGLPVTYVIEPGGTIVQIHNGIVDSQVLEDLTKA